MQEDLLLRRVVRRGVDLALDRVPGGGPLGVGQRLAGQRADDLVEAVDAADVEPAQQQAAVLDECRAQLLAALADHRQDACAALSPSLATTWGEASSRSGCSSVMSPLGPWQPGDGGLRRFRLGGSGGLLGADLLDAGGQARPRSASRRGCASAAGRRPPCAARRSAARRPASCRRGRRSRPRRRWPRRRAPPATPARSSPPARCAAAIPPPVGSRGASAAPSRSVAIVSVVTSLARATMSATGWVVITTWRPRSVAARRRGCGGTPPRRRPGGCPRSSWPTAGLVAVLGGRARRSPRPGPPCAARSR